MKPGYKQTELGVIPEDWEVSEVRQRGQVITGKALAVNAPGAQRPYLRTKNVFDGRIEIDDVLTMPMTDEQFAQFEVRPGDVLLNEGQSLELVGRCSIYRGEFPEPCAIQNALLRFRARQDTSAVFASYLFRHCQHTGVFARISLQTTSIAHLGGPRFERLRLPWPRLPEQCAIAEALSDVDGLLSGLDRLIAKKRDLKQATMQQLLTAKARLPGFHGGWVEKSLGEMARIEKGQQLHSSECRDHGTVPHYNGGTEPSGFTDRSNTAGETIAISEGGNSCGYVHFIARPFWCGGHCYALTPLGVEKPFLYHALKARQLAIMGLRVGSGLPNVQKTALTGFRFAVPVESAEQSAIAEVLSEMDAELEALERRREKTRALKQAMMQQLLTGQTRLVVPKESEVIADDFTAPKPGPVPVAASVSAPSEKKHNWAINEAVVVSVLVKRFGSEKFPLGRKRCTKLSYLLHRHVEHVAQGYLKKAAGPYNPAVKYRGPEGIAQKNGYIRPHKNGTYSGFVAAGKIDQAERYFAEWYGSDVLHWLDQFRFKSNDDLERLATVDMAMEELRRAGDEISLSSVRALIASEPEWVPKLDRSAFSDQNITAAIQQCRTLFPS